MDEIKNNRSISQGALLQRGVPRSVNHLWYATRGLILTDYHTFFHQAS
jgi:hypothetical protein